MKSRMESKEKLLYDIRYITERITELDSEIKRGLEAIEERRKSELILQQYMVSYLRLSSKTEVILINI